MGKRQDIITAAGVKFATITIANGYNTDIGNNVNEWKVIADEESDLPSLHYRDASVEVLEIEGQDNYFETKKLNLEVEIRVSGTTTPATLRLMIEDVLAAVGKDINWSNNAYDTDYEGDTMDIDQDNLKIGSVLMNIAIGYQVKNWTD